MEHVTRTNEYRKKKKRRNFFSASCCTQIPGTVYTVQIMLSAAVFILSVQLLCVSQYSDDKLSED